MDEIHATFITRHALVTPTEVATKSIEKRFSIRGWTLLLHDWRPAWWKSSRPRTRTSSPPRES